MEQKLLVVLIDDDESVRESLPDLLRELGYAAMPFSSAQEFLASGCLPNVDCLIVDIAMSGMSGPELQRELGSRGNGVPVIFITAHGDKSVRSFLRRQGAVEVLFKPFSEQDLLSALKAALPPR